MGGGCHQEGRAPEREPAVPNGLFSSLAGILPDDLAFCVCQVTSVVSHSLGPHGLQPTRLLCPWDSPGKNTGVGSHALLQGNLPDPGIELVSLTSPALAGRFFTANVTWDGCPFTQVHFLFFKNCCCSRRREFF